MDLLEFVGDLFLEPLALMLGEIFGIASTAEPSCGIQTLFGNDVWWNSNSQLDVGRQLRQPLYVFNMV